MGAGLDGVQAALAVMNRGLRPEIPPQTPAAFARLMQVRPLCALLLLPLPLLLLPPAAAASCIVPAFDARVAPACLVALGSQRFPSQQLPPLQLSPSG